MISIVPIPFNFYEVEIGAIPTTIHVKKFKVGIGRASYQMIKSGQGNIEAIRQLTLSGN
jgi:hypothetical protein